MATVAEVGLVQAALDSALAVSQLLAYSRFHLKSLRGTMGVMVGTTMKPRKTPRDFKFFKILRRQGPETSLG
jgi:hypothetical protein